MSTGSRRLHASLVAGLALLICGCAQPDKKLWSSAPPETAMERKERECLRLAEEAVPYDHREARAALDGTLLLPIVPGDRRNQGGPTSAAVQRSVIYACEDVAEAELSYGAEDPRVIEPLLAFADAYRSVGTETRAADVYLRALAINAKQEAAASESGKKDICLRVSTLSVISSAVLRAECGLPPPPPKEGEASEAAENRVPIFPSPDHIRGMQELTKELLQNATKRAVRPK